MSTIRRRASPASAPIVITLLAVFACADLWLGGGFLNTRQGGDSPFLLQRTFELVQGLQDGALPVRWMAHAAYGFGYPFFNFYAALPYYLAAALDLAGVNLLDSVRLIQVLGMLGAGFAMLRLARALLGRLPAIVASACYMLIPFHLVNLYVRGDSLSEFWAFVWYPLILHGLWRLTEAGSVPATESAPVLGTDPTRTAWLELTLSLAALVMTHNVSALLFAPFVLLIALARLVGMARRPALRPAALPLFGLLALSALAALALSAWFWLPALGEANAVNLGDQTTGYFSYANHFRGLDLVQRSPYFDYNNGENPFSMGLVQAVLSVLGLVAVLVGRLPTSTKVLIMGGFVLSTFLMTPLSNPIWAALPPLQLAQFPWRLLSVQAVFCALATGGLCAVPRRLSPSNDAGPLSAVIALVVVSMYGVAALAGVPNERLQIGPDDVTVPNLQLYEWVTGNIGTTIRAEYLPDSARPRPFTGPTLLGLGVDALAFVPDGDFAQQQTSTSNEQRWLILVTHDRATIVLPTTYWRGWRASTPGLGAIPVTPDPGTGWISITLPRGEHQLELAMVPTPLQQAGTLLFALALFALTGAWFFLAVDGWPSAIGRTILLIIVCWAAVAGVGRLLGGICFPNNQGCNIDVVQRGDARSPQALLVDFAHRPYPNRSPLVFTSTTGAPFVLTGVEIVPAKVRAGDPFSVSLTWQDGHAPGEFALLQQAPSGVLDKPGASPIFRFEADKTAITNQPQTLRVLPGALPGPILLKPLAGDLGRPLTQIDADGRLDDDFWLVGPTVVAGARAAQPVLREMAGIILHQVDWIQQDATHVCIRPVWSAATPIRAALRVRLRLLGADGGEIARVENQPITGIAPTWSWQPGVPVRDSYCNTAVDAGLMPRAGGAFGIEVVWYRQSDLFETARATLTGVRADDQPYVAYPAR